MADTMKTVEARQISDPSVVSDCTDNKLIITRQFLRFKCHIFFILFNVAQVCSRLKQINVE